MEPGETENFAGLEAAFTCRLCEDRLDHEDLEMLPCGHAFCAACLRDETVDEYVCPECRVPFIVKDITKSHDLQEAIQPGLELLGLVAQLNGEDETRVCKVPAARMSAEEADKRHKDCTGVAERIYREGTGIPARCFELAEANGLFHSPEL